MFNSKKIKDLESRVKWLEHDRKSMVDDWRELRNRLASLERTLGLEYQFIPPKDVHVKSRLP